MKECIEIKCQGLGRSHLCFDSQEMDLFWFSKKGERKKAEVRKKKIEVMREKKEKEREEFQRVV